jgi:hypothetical protein
MSSAVGKEQRTVEEWQVNWGRPYTHSVADQTVKRTEDNSQRETKPAKDKLQLGNRKSPVNRNQTVGPKEESN